MLFMAGKQHGGTEIFARELLPRWRQVFLFVHTLHLHVQYHMEKLRIFIRRVAGIQLWSEGKDYKYMIRYGTLLLPPHKRLTHWLNFNMVVPGAMKPLWNWIWKICVLVT